MKMKILLVLIFFLILTILTYSQLQKEEINYTILGDKEVFSNNLISKNFSDLIYDNLKEEKDFGFYCKDYIKENIRIIDVINDINYNYSIDNIYIQNILDRTNILIINVGNNEIKYKLSEISENENNDYIIYNYLDEEIEDIKKLIKTIKDYNDGNIIFLGFYNNTGNIKNNKYYEYINKKTLKIMKENNVEFIDLYNILNKNEDYLTNTFPVYITNDGNMAIFNKIYSKIDKLYLHKRS